MQTERTRNMLFDVVLIPASTLQEDARIGMSWET